MRLGLDKDDELELLRWVQQSSLERVARIVAFLADARGEHGQPEKPDTLLLLKIAHLKREQPHRTLHSIAVEVARDADQLRRPRISRESLVTKLERDYKRRRHTWTLLAGSTPPPDSEEISRGVRRPKFGDEFRVLNRIIEVLPTAIDLYDALLADAKKLGPDAAKMVHSVGRERAEPFLIEAIKRQTTFIGGQDTRKIPRSLFDLVEPELRRFQEDRKKALTRREPVRRNPPQQI